MEPQENNKIGLLHQQLVKDKYAVPSDLKGFEEIFKNPENSKKLFDQLIQDKYAIPSDYDSFINTFGLKKKDYASDLYSGIFSKVAGDIPKLEKDTPEKEVTTPTDTQVSYPQWADVSKALGIDLPKDTSGISETVGGAKPEPKKPPSLEDIKAVSPKKEVTQPADKTIAKVDVRESYIFTIEDYLKKRGVDPESVGLKPDVNIDRLIDADERKDFDKKLEAKGLYSPSPQYRESYTGAFMNGLYHGTANMIRDIGYVLNELPGEAQKAFAETGVKIGAKLKGYDSETTKKYVEQVAAMIDSGMYGTYPSVMKEGYEGAAKWLESAVKTRTPDTEWGRALENVGAFIPDLISISFLPEAKAPLLVKWGMQGMLKFPTYLGVKTYVEGAKEGKPLKEIIPTSAEAAAQGMVFNGLGVWAHEIGGIAQSVGAGLWTSKSAEVLANSLGFGGITTAQGGSATEGMLEGLAFSALGTPNAIKQGMQKKAMLNWMTSTNNNIRIVTAQKIDPFKARKESIELWEKAQALPEGEQKDHLLWQKNIVDNTIDMILLSCQTRYSKTQMSSLRTSMRTRCCLQGRRRYGLTR